MKRRILVVLAMVAVGLLVAGCKATGGGYIPSTIPGEKATFAFNGKCTNTKTTDAFGDVVGKVKGQIQYNDRAADVKFHAEIDDPFIIPGSSTPCEDADRVQDGNVDSFTGTYRVSGVPKEEQASQGLVELTVLDAGEPGINGDQVAIFLSFGQYDGYSNSGTAQEGNVKGGNVQVH